MRISKIMKCKFFVYPRLLEIRTVYEIYLSIKGNICSSELCRFLAETSLQTRKYYQCTD